MAGGVELHANSFGLQVQAFCVVRSRIDLRLAEDNGLPGGFATNPAVEHVRPHLHESPPRPGQTCMVVGCSDVVLLLVGQAGLDQGPRKKGIVEP